MHGKEFVARHCDTFKEQMRVLEEVFDNDPAFLAAILAQSGASSLEELKRWCGMS